MTYKKKIDDVADSILELFNDSGLSAIEIFGTLEMVRQEIHRSCICNECRKKGADI